MRAKRVRLTQAKRIKSKPIKLVPTPDIVNDLNRLTRTIPSLRFRAAFLLEVSAKDPLTGAKVLYARRLTGRIV